MRCKLIGLPAMVRTTRNRSSPAPGVTAAPHVIRLSFDRQDDQLFLSPCPPSSIGATAYCQQTYRRAHAHTHKKERVTECHIQPRLIMHRRNGRNVSRRSMERRRHSRTPQTRAGGRCTRRPSAADSGRPYRRTIAERAPGRVAPLGKHQ